jgi:hypothetical protein
MKQSRCVRMSSYSRTTGKIIAVLPLDREFLGQGEAAADAEGFAGDFQAWGGLFAFVFVLIDAEGY